jgi:O-antigen/teichoic acid export membrane protein
MPAEVVEPSQPKIDTHRSAFFRQSGWMMIATVLSGVFMYAVHMIAKNMPKESGEYGLFTTLLQTITLMGIPAVGLQVVFAQQAAAALSETQERQLAGDFWGVVKTTFGIWLVMALVVVGFWHPILTALKVTNPAAIAWTVLIALASLWFPISMGMLQGRQNFLWLGWLAIFNGIGRFAAIFVIVGLLGCYAAGAMVGVLIGISTATAVGFFELRKYLHPQPLPFDAIGWLKRAGPLTLGLGAAQFMLSADMIYVRHFFSPEQSVYYSAAGMIGRALVFFTAPLTAVMFPKLVRSAARAEKTDVLAQVIGITLLLGVAAAIGCTLFPRLPLRIVYDKSYIDIAAPLVPWFVWCMVPLTLSNVLINSLMAQARFISVIPMVLVAAGYATALYFYHDSFLTVIRTLGIFGLLMVAVCAWFAWGPGKKRTAKV